MILTGLGVYQILLIIPNLRLGITNILCSISLDLLITICLQTNSRRMGLHNFKAAPGTQGPLSRRQFSVPSHVCRCILSSSWISMLAINSLLVWLFISKSELVDKLVEVQRHVRCESLLKARFPSSGWWKWCMCGSKLEQGGWSYCRGRQRRPDMIHRSCDSD